MSEPIKKNDPKAKHILPVEDWRLEATVAHVESNQAAAARLPAEGEKPSGDLAFAVALRDSGFITEGRLALATRDWTAFGSTRLADHLVRQSMISGEQASELQRAADGILQRAAGLQTRSGQETDADSEHALISRINPDGRLARLLGMSGRSTVQQGQIEDREVGARYTLLRKLGQGGLGTVWLARDENLNRYVAVKELTGDAQAGDVALEHFRREAEITGRLEHPGIVPIYQFGHDEKSGKAFYAMRFLGRRTLQDAIDEYHERRESGADEKMLLHRLLTSFVGVCHSVGHAHAEKVIHRDLKPANVALDEFGQVTLLDWGLSKVNHETGMYEFAGRAEPGDLHDQNSGNAGRVIGTPLYMAPEQAAGRLEDVDELTDVYGLGGILYSILTGFGPHQVGAESGDTGISRENFLLRIVAGEVIPPAERTTGVKPELNAICMKALSSRRYRRYQSATELADEVQRYMAGAPVHAYRAPFRHRVSLWMVRHPTLSQILWLAISLILISGIVFALTAREARQRLVGAKYASALETTRDLEVNLQFEARALERDLHFITDLPLMTAITQSQLMADGAAPPLEAPRVDNGRSKQPVSSRKEAQANPAEGDVPEETAPVKNAEFSFQPRSGSPIDVSLQTPEQWLNREGELFDGFLNANPTYLMMSTCVREQDNVFRELVRSERVSSAMPANRVPKKQLDSADAASIARDPEVLEILRPGSVLLITNDNMLSGNSSPLVLSGVAAIYDVEGDFFGINTIELDLRERLRNLLPAIAPEYVDVLVTNASGQIVMDFRDGRFFDVPGTKSVTTDFPELAEMFGPGSTLREQGDDLRYYARLVQLGDSASHAKFGIIAHVDDTFKLD